MPSTIGLEPAHQSPRALCLKHFLGVAREYHKNSEPELFRSFNVLPIPKSAGLNDKPKPKTQAVATRIQPRRAAKDKVIQAQALNKKSKKRPAEDADDSERPVKKVKGREFRGRILDPTVWEDVRVLLIEEVYRDVVADRERQECHYGPKPWVCTLCEKLDVKYGEELGSFVWNYHKGTAPAAEMKPSGVDLHIAAWDKLTTSERRVHDFGELKFIIDNCKNTMVLVI